MIAFFEERIDRGLLQQQVAWRSSAPRTIPGSSSACAVKRLNPYGTPVVATDLVDLAAPFLRL
jgi:hypothetical protein